MFSIGIENQAIASVRANPKRDIAGCLVVRVDHFHGVFGSGIVLAVPSATGYKLFQLCNAHASVSEIIAEVKLRQSEVSRARPSKET